MIPTRPVAALLERLDGVRRSGAGWEARCPAHEDRRASLGVAEGQDGRALLTCHAGCDTAAIVSALGLTMADLFPPRERQDRPARKVVATYDYRDETGALLYQVVRFEPKGFAQRRPGGNGGWTWSMAGARRVLYRLPEVLAAVKAGRTLCVVEGEKDVDALAAVGVTATTNPGGAGKWAAECGEALRGAKVMVLPDNDDPGRKHADQVAAALDGIAAEVRVVALPDLPPKGDVSDWLAAGGTVRDLARLWEAAPGWVPGAPLESLESLQMPRDGDSRDCRDCRGEEAWPDLVPLDGATALPGWPAGVLPGWLEEWANAEAEALQVPQDLPAMLGLAMCAAAVARKVAVLVREGWTEPVNLYAVVAMHPGEAKSPVFEAATKPIGQYEAEEAERMKPEIAEAETRLKIAEAARDRAQTAAAAAKTSAERAKHTEEAAAQARDVAQMTVPVAPRLVVDDITPEALASMLAEQGGRIALMSPEGDIFDIMAGRYSANGAPNLGVFLKGHAGDTLRVNRRGRQEYVPGPALTLGLAVQPEVLQGLMSKRGFRGRGLLGRFLYSLPTSKVGHRNEDATPVPAAVRDAYGRAVRALLALPMPQDVGGAPNPHLLRLDPEADEEFRAFRRWLEPGLGETGTLGGMKDWAAKLAGTVARIAGVLHLASRAEEREPWAAPVSGDTMRAAVRLAREYLTPHAQAAYGLMGTDPAIEAARHVLRWLVEHGAARYPKQAIWQGTRGRFERAADLDAALAILAERGYVRPLPLPDRPGPGRKGAPDYALHPRAGLLQSLESLQMPPEDDSRDCRDSRGAENAGGADAAGGRDGLEEVAI